MASETKQESYLADKEPSIVQLAIKPHWDALSSREKKYAHFLSRASFSGTRITLRQISPESEMIFDFILALYRACKGDWGSLPKLTGVTDEELKLFLAYAAQFLGNSGNYKSFGDTKFVPDVKPEFFIKISAVGEKVESLLHAIGNAFFPTSFPGQMLLGFPSDGHISTYYPDSPSITKEEIQAVGEFLEGKGFRPENTRLRKLSSGDFECLVASAQSRSSSLIRWDLSPPLDGKKLELKYGDHGKVMKDIADNMKHVQLNALNDNQAKMHAEYVEHFLSGSTDAFSESQKWWIKDKGPKVECNIGFIETYRDPAGIRGEWEGFVAMVNMERTKVFQELVSSAEKLLEDLPWPKTFEKDTFLMPDFTSLEVLSFAGSGIPAGINIPNLDDIRQTLGFKNVSLGNVLSAKAPNEKVPFIRDEDQELYSKHRDVAFEVQVGLHELLGHGTGKLFQETEPGVYNFDVKTPPQNPITGEPIKTWYKPGQTWGSVFGSVASSYEECRAECVAMVLSCNYGVLKLFGLDTGKGPSDPSSEASDVLYTAYLSMARAGIAAMQFWDPKSRKWGQIHMQARFAILICLLQAGDVVALSHSKASSPKDVKGLTVSVSRERIVSVGAPAIAKFLNKLHVYKSTADFAAGKQLYEEMTAVDEWFGGPVREEVIRQKLPRKVFVQANTVIDDKGEVTLVEYEPTPAGMIQSWAERNV